MKMSKFEKQFVNSSGHSLSVGRAALRRLEQLSPTPRQTYLDIGCGNGEAAIQIAREFDLQVTGIDIDPAQIELAKYKSADLSEVAFAVENSLDLSFADNSFDYAAANKVTHHIPAWELALSEMIRVLKPQGILLFNDLIFPEWVARVGRRILGNQAGFPTYRRLMEITEQAEMSLLKKSKRALVQEVILQKIDVSGRNQAIDSCVIPTA